MAGEKKRSAIARGGERRRWPCCWSMGIVLAFVGKLIRNNLPDLQHYETEKSVSLANPYLAVLHKTILAIAFLYAANNILGEQAYLKFEQPVGAFRLRLKDPDGRLTYKDFAAAPYCGKRECSEMACSCKRGQEKCKTTAGSKCKCKTKGGKTKCTVQCSSDSAADCKCSSKKGKKKCVQQRCGRSACRWLDSADITHGFMNSAFFVSTRISERPERFECIRPVAPLPDGCLADAASFPQGREQAQRCCEAGKWQQNTRDERHAKSFYVAHVEDVRLKVLASVEFPGFLRSAEETGKSCASGDGAGRPNPPCSAYYAPSTSDLVGDLKHDTGEGCMHSFPLGDDELPLATWLRSAGFGLDDASDSPGTKGGLDRYRDEGSVLIFKVAFNNVDDNEFGLLDWASGQVRATLLVLLVLVLLVMVLVVVLVLPLLLLTLLLQTPPMRYSYFTERVKKSEFKHDEIRQAERVDSASAELQRLLWRRHGLFIQFQCTGRVAEARRRRPLVVPLEVVLLDALRKRRSVTQAVESAGVVRDEVLQAVVEPLLILRVARPQLLVRLVLGAVAVIQQVGTEQSLVASASGEDHGDPVGLELVAAEALVLDAELGHGARHPRALDEAVDVARVAAQQMEGNRRPPQHLEDVFTVLRRQGVDLLQNPPGEDRVDRGQEGSDLGLVRFVLGGFKPHVLVRAGAAAAGAGAGAGAGTAAETAACAEAICSCICRCICSICAACCCCSVSSCCCAASCAAVGPAGTGERASCSCGCCWICGCG